MDEQDREREGGLNKERVCEREREGGRERERERERVFHTFWRGRDNTDMVGVHVCVVDERKRESERERKR